MTRMLTNLIWMCCAAQGIKLIDMNRINSVKILFRIYRTNYIHFCIDLLLVFDAQTIQFWINKTFFLVSNLWCFHLNQMLQMSLQLILKSNVELWTSVVVTPASMQHMLILLNIRFGRRSFVFATRFLFHPIDVSKVRNCTVATHRSHMDTQRHSATTHAKLAPHSPNIRSQFRNTLNNVWQLRSMLYAASTVTIWENADIG